MKMSSGKGRPICFGLDDLNYGSRLAGYDRLENVITVSVLYLNKNDIILS